jgi:hypothetical protein
MRSLRVVEHVEGLLAFDANRDGILISLDPFFACLHVWSDRNHNGVSDNGELISASEAGIASPSLRVFGKASLNTANTASQTLGKAVVTMEDGRTTTAFDIALEAEVASYRGCHTGLPLIGPAEFHPR